MMTEKQVRSYRNDLRTCLGKLMQCGYSQCSLELLTECRLVQAQIDAVTAVLVEADANKEIEEAAAMARRSTT